MPTCNITIRQTWVAPGSCRSFHWLYNLSAFRALPDINSPSWAVAELRLLCCFFLFLQPFFNWDWYLLVSYNFAIKVVLYYTLIISGLGQFLVKIRFEAKQPVKTNFWCFTDGITSKGNALLALWQLGACGLHILWARIQLRESVFCHVVHEDNVRMWLCELSHML